MILLTTLLAIFSVPSQASEFPQCKADLRDSMNNVLATKDWEQDLFIDSISDGTERPVLISTSAGNNKIVSFWVREKMDGNPNGMFSFVDLSSGREQTLRLYLANGNSVGVSCIWPE